MDQFDIYVNMERPAGKPSKRKSLEKCSEKIYQNEDDTVEPIKTEAKLSGEKHLSNGTYYNRMLTVGSCACIRTFFLKNLSEGKQRLNVFMVEGEKKDVREVSPQALLLQ